MYFCRECSKFVGGPLCTCNSCGFIPDRDNRQLEEPIRKRRKRQLSFA